MPESCGAGFRKNAECCTNIGIIPKWIYYDLFTFKKFLYKLVDLQIYHIVHSDTASCSNLPCDHWYPDKLQNLAEPVCNIKGNCYRLKEYGGHSKHAFSSCDGKICRYSGICYSPSSADHND